MKKQLLDEPRAHLYMFAHQAIRHICAQDPLRFFALISSSEQRGFLDWIWKTVEDHLGQPANGISAAEVEVATCRIKGFPSILMKMPAPEAELEAYAIGIVLTGAPQEDQEALERPEFRYFTLECGTNLDGSSRTVLCEWKDDTHSNYGDGPMPTIEDFTHAIDAIIHQT